ncbi:MAG: energy transducer TonB [Bacteroidetes bacterium]|nr:MAG: energy transducer TonB [Bacteroidota bacterium]
MKVLILVLSNLMLVAAAWGQTKPAADSTQDSNKIFTKVDVPAEFPGGIEGWKSHLESNLKYPKKAQRKDIQGLVKVSFLVDRTGAISEVMAMNDPGGGLAEEAVRVIKEGPKWKPATQNGKKVIYRHIQAITFVLE